MTELIGYFCDNIRTRLNEDWITTRNCTAELQVHHVNSRCSRTFWLGCVLCMIRVSKNSKNIFHHVPSLDCGVTGVELTLVNQQ